MGTEHNENLYKQKYPIIKELYLRRLPEKLDLIDKFYADVLEDKSDIESYKAILYVVHGLSGTAAMFGIDRLTPAVNKAENLINSIVSCEQDYKRKDIKNSVIECFDSIKIIIQDVLESFKNLEHIVQTGVMKVKNDIKTKSIVYLTNHDILGESAAKQLELYGLDVHIVSTIEDFEIKVKDVEPIVIASDMGFYSEMPNVCTLFKDIKSKSDNKIKVIFFSKRGDFYVRLSAVRCGSDAFFVSPIEGQDIINYLDNLSSRIDYDPYRILIVEDDPIAAEHYGAMLESAGMITRLCFDPVDVSSMIIEFNPDLILLDMYMPMCEGTELAEVIRQQKRFVSIPIVFLSAEQRVEKHLEALKLGGDDFITKPVLPDYLISSIVIRAQRLRILRSFMERDGLTSLLNHTKVKEFLEFEMSRVKRHNSRLSYAMIDIDDFKKINDTYGHLTGDRIIYSLAKLLTQRLRKTDVVGRYGGEEFAVVFYETDAENAAIVVEKMRKDFAEVEHISDKGVFKATFSCGITDSSAFRSAVLINDMADKALYKAKNSGKNCVYICKSDKDFVRYSHE